MEESKRCCLTVGLTLALLLDLLIFYRFVGDIEQLQMQSKINRKSPERVQKLIPDNKSRNLHLMLSKIDNFYKTHEVNRDLEIM